MEHPISTDQLSPQVARVCGPEAPAQLKEMAASGQAPLGPKDLVTALYVLAYDKNEEIAGKARASLTTVPEDVLRGALDQVDSVLVLDGLAQLLLKKVSAQERILLNKATGGDTVAWIAKSSREDRVLQMVASNEARMLKHPEIIAALYNNKATRMSTADRAIELAARNNVEVKGIACFAEIKAALEGRKLERREQEQQTTEFYDFTEEPTGDDLMFHQTLDFDEWLDFDEETFDDMLDARQDGLDDDEDAQKVKSAQQEISRMGVSAKIRLAILGNEQQRAILIRDSNKLVCMSVVKSPMLRDSEVTKYAKFRSLPDEALRYMATKKEWIKHYGVKLALVQNPRCPIEYSMRFIPHLRNQDIRALERDKNVPGAIAKAAKNLRNKRMK